MATSGRRREARRIVLGAIVVSLTATALAAIAILLFGRFGETELRILGTTALLAAYGLLALPAGFLVDQQRLRGLAAAVVVLAVAGLAGALTALWAENGSETIGKVVGTVTAFAVAATQTAALSARRRGRDVVVVRRLFSASVGLVVLAAAMLAAALWAELDGGTYFRILGALVVLDVLVVALQPILAAGRGEAAAHRLRVTVEDGDEIETTIEAPDLATAAAKAIRSAERAGRRVTSVSVDSVPWREAE